MSIPLLLSCSSLFYHLKSCPGTSYGAVSFFDLANSANVHSYRAEKLKGSATGGGFRTSEHNADFFPDLVREDAHAIRFGNRRS